MVSFTTLTPINDARGSLSFTPTAARPAVTPPQPASGRRNVPIGVLAIGSSTGGPIALAERFGLLPCDLGIPVLITQHMPPVLTQLLAERLDRGSGIKVKEAFDGAVVRPGEAWVAPGDFHMIVTREGTDTILRINKTQRGSPVKAVVDVSKAGSMRKEVRRLKNS